MQKLLTEDDMIVVEMVQGQVNERMDKLCKHIVGELIQIAHKAQGELDPNRDHMQAAVLTARQVAFSYTFGHQLMQTLGAVYISALPLNVGTITLAKLCEDFLKGACNAAEGRITTHLQVEIACAEHDRELLQVIDSTKRMVKLIAMQMLEHAAEAKKGDRINRPSSPNKIV